MKDCNDEVPLGKFDISMTHRGKSKGLNTTLLKRNDSKSCKYNKIIHKLSASNFAGFINQHKSDLYP